MLDPGLGKTGATDATAAKARYMSATGNPIPVLGTFDAKATLDRSTSRTVDVTFNVTKSHQLSLLGRTSIASLNIDVRRMIQEAGVNTGCEDLGLLAVAEDSPGRGTSKGLPAVVYRISRTL